jgi:manganese oxidase
VGHVWRRPAVVATATVGLVLTMRALFAGAPAESLALSDIAPNENDAPAGRLSGGVLTVHLVAAAGTWYPEGPDGRGRRAYAFGESRSALRNPGPLLRVPIGTEIRATVRNAIEGDTLTVHGLHDRPGPPDVFKLAPGGATEVRFRVSEAGTFLYWASTRGARTLVDRFGEEGQLSGALVVDPSADQPRDRVFVIGMEEDSAAIPPQRTVHAATVNGRSWPYDLLYDVAVGDTVRMRWVNASARLHPMHLHGFYFRIDARGDIAADTIYGDAFRRQVVTELLESGTTMSMTWVPEREGNWLMHCHMTDHIRPELRSTPPRHTDAHVSNHALGVMAGLVTGWRVAPAKPDRESGSGVEAFSPRRKIRLLVQAATRRYGDAPALGFVVQHGASEPAPDSVVIPGPPLILTRGEPVEITLVNRLDEPTSVHWHGMELDSYFDGVSGWSGNATRISPPVMAGDSFIVHITPPRAGTFIYHSHFEEERQLSSGLYGPLIVTEPGAGHDPDTDLSWVLSQGGPHREIQVLFNGTTSPTVTLDAGRVYRIRLININPNIPLRFALMRDSLPVQWKAVAKDGADLPPHQVTVRPATQLIGVGEAYDFELAPTAPSTWRMTAHGPFGPVRLSGEVRIR